MSNTLFYGDNLGWLRDSEKFPSESVDLIYLDPPFNSQRNYNLIYRDREGRPPQAQLAAFEDTWSWTDRSAEAYLDVLASGSRAAGMLQAFRSFLRQSDMMAYIAMMTVRLDQLHRILDPKGALYLHCDPVASPYLRIILDSIFGPENFRSEIVWRRSAAHNKLSRQYGPVHDTIL
jgi:adenine specific DNA methylase Mod